MTREEAIEAIKCNWPDSRYTILREALDMAISALRQQDVADKDVGKNDPLTNAQKIRSMSDEELALWICGVYDIEEEHGKLINGIIIPGYAPHDIEEWLQQTAEEDDHDERKENENV